MKRYSVKCRDGKVEYFDILSENEESYRIRLTRLNDGEKRVFEDTMSKNLFDMCLKSGYILEVEDPGASAVSEAVA